MIYKTITDSYEFANWVKNSDSYSNNFTVQGAKALQEYLEQLSDELNENIEFDPIAWCCKYSEYETAQEAYEQYGNDTLNEREALDYLNNNTTVIEFDGGVIIQDF